MGILKSTENQDFDFTKLHILHNKRSQCLLTQNCQQ